MQRIASADVLSGVDDAADGIKRFAIEMIEIERPPSAMLRMVALPRKRPQEGEDNASPESSP